MEHTYRQTSRIHSVIFIGIIFLLVFAPLAFGSVHVWAYSVVEIGVCLLLILWFLGDVHWNIGYWPLAGRDKGRRAEGRNRPRREDRSQMP